MVSHVAFIICLITTQVLNNCIMQLKDFRGPHNKCWNILSISNKGKPTMPLEEHTLFPSITRADADFSSKFIKIWVQINWLCMLFGVPSVPEVGSFSSPRNSIQKVPHFRFLCWKCQLAAPQNSNVQYSAVPPTLPPGEGFALPLLEWKTSKRG